MIHYSIIIKSNHWPKRQKKIDEIVKLILKQKKLFNFNKNIIYYCSFILMNDSLIKKFNKLYKKHNKITDVLTFVSNIKRKINKEEKYCDIVLSAEILAKDALNNKINFYDHITHIIVHSLLHISGYKHKNNYDSLIMQRKEIKILNNLGISNPYL